MSENEINSVQGMPVNSGDVIMDDNDEFLEGIEEEEVVAQTPLEELEELVSGLENAPNKLDLEQWKDIHGQFYASSVNGDDVFIWKTLRRLEYRSIAASGALEKQESFENAVARKCLLWPSPSPQFFAGGDAGTIPTLFKQVMHQSGFISDEVAISMIRRV